MFEPKEATVFNLALDKLQNDPRVTVRLGAPVTGYGVESRSRSARHRIRHRFYNDDNGVEHVQVHSHTKKRYGMRSIEQDKCRKSRWFQSWVYMVQNTGP